VVFLAFCAVYAAWLVVVHVFLWTPLLRNAIGDHQKTVRVDYHFAWSLFPGTVHASGFVLTVQDHVQQFRLAIDDLTASVVLGQLTKRTFHADKVRAHGITFAMRRRLPPGKLTREALEGIPEIDGLPPLPVMESEPDDRIPDSRYALFSVWLENIQGDDVRILWFDKLRFDGKAQVSGAFYLKPQREVLIAPGRLDIESGSLRSRQTAMAEDIHGGLELRVGPLDPRDMKATDFARAASLDSDLEARLPGLGILGAKGGKGRIHVAARVKEGRIAEGNLIDLQVGPTALAPLRAASISLHVEDKRAQLDVAEVTAPGARVARAKIALSGDPPDLAALELPRSLALDLEGGQIDDAKELTRTLPPPLQLLGGSGTFAAHISGPPSNGSGYVNATVEQLAIDARNQTFHADLAVNAKLQSLDLRRGADLSGTKIAIEHGGIRSEPKARSWWGRFVLPRAQFRFAGPELLDVDLVANCRDARPIVGLYARTGSLPGSTKKLFVMDGLHVWGSAAVGRQWVVLRDLHARGAGAEIRAVYRRERSDEEGAVWVKVGVVPLAIGLGKQGGLHIFGPGDFFTERKAALGRAPALPPLRRRRHRQD
jgi:hypothetical protein